MADPIKIYKTGKKVFDLGKKYLPNATEAEQKAFKAKVSDLEVDMSHNSAVSLALNEARFGLKPAIKNPGVTSGPPPKSGPNPQGIKVEEKSMGGCIHRQPSKKNIYPGHNAIQKRGFKFTGVR